MQRESYRLPAEWDEQSMVQLTWPHAATDWLPTLDDITATYIEMAVEIARRERLLIVTPNATETLAQIRPHATAAMMDNITVFECPTNDTWARDHAFITLTDGCRKRFLDFRFNGWGEKFEATLDNAINSRLYSAGMLDGDYDDNLDFVLEGGSIESDGQGTVFTTRCCLLAPHRNQPLTERQIEQRLKCSLGAQRVVWIDAQPMDGDDTDGHIDTMVRVAPNHTLLYNDTLRLPDTFTTSDGTVLTFKLKPLPMPRPIVVGGEQLPATYANFLVVNGAVLCPTYGQPDLDSQAMSVIESAFPQRDVVGIDCRNIIVQHGSLHCCTMQYPK